MYSKEWMCTVRSGCVQCGMGVYSVESVQQGVDVYSEEWVCTVWNGCVQCGVCTARSGCVQ